MAHRPPLDNAQYFQEESSSSSSFNTKPKAFNEQLQEPCDPLPVVVDDHEYPNTFIYSTTTQPIEATQRDDDVYKPLISELQSVQELKSRSKNASASIAGDTYFCKENLSTSIKDKANQLVSAVVEKNPNAQGVVLLTHSETAPENESLNLKPLLGIEKGTRELREIFTALGLAVVYLPNSERELLIAVIFSMSSKDYPECYKYFVLYTTGHGAERWFYTKDGDIPYCDVVNNFYFKDHHIRMFVFDCCRSPGIKSIDMHSMKPEFNLTQNSRIMYATLSGKQAWGKDGVSFMTKEMIKALPNSSSMDEVFRVVTKGIPGSQTPTDHDATKNDPALSREQQERIKGHLKFKEFSTDQHTFTFELEVKPPLATTADNAAFVKCEILMQPTSNDSWEPLHSISELSEKGEFTSNKPVTVNIERKVPFKWLKRKIKLKALVHYRGERITAESNIIEVNLILPNLRRPMGITGTIIEEPDPAVRVSWSCNTAHCSYPKLCFGSFTISAKYLDTGISKDKTLEAELERETYECIIPFHELYSFGRTRKRLTIEVTAVRNDDQVIHGDSKDIDIPTVRAEGINIEVIRWCKLGLKIVWQQRKLDPSISGYTIHVMDAHDHEIVPVRNVVLNPHNERNYYETILFKTLFDYSVIKVQIISRRVDPGEETKSPVETVVIKHVASY